MYYVCVYMHIYYVAIQQILSTPNQIFFIFFYTRDKCALNAKVIIVKNGIGNTSSNTDGAVSVLLRDNALEEGINPFVFPQTLDK